MRYISVTDKRTGHEDIVCVSKAAKIIGVSRSTMYRWDEKFFRLKISRQEEYRHWIVNFDITIHPISKKHSH